MNNNINIPFVSVNGIDSVFQTEQISILIGRNGSGKSELLKLVNSNKEVIRFEERYWFDFGKDIKPLTIKSNSLVLISNIEYGLDPTHIRKLIRDLNHLAYDKNCLVIGITYSPIVLNEFQFEDYASIFTFPDDSNKSLMSLDKFKDPGWLHHFSLGDLYDRELLF